MGKVSISLPDELIKELEESARVGNRGFSAEVRMRLENERNWRMGASMAVRVVEASECEKGEADRVEPYGGPTGVAKITIEAAKEIPEDPVLLEYPDLGKGAKVPVLKSGKFEGVSKLAKKIASEVPGVKLASEVNTFALVKDEKGIRVGLNLDSFDEPKSEKSRPKESKGEVTLTKGFWTDKFASVEAAEVKAKEMGWVAGEYEIKPVN